MTTTETPVFSLVDLEFKFKPAKNDSPTDSKDTFVLGPLNFQIPKGKLTSILGRSGSGKTTLLSLIGLLRSQNNGAIQIHLNDEVYEADQLWKNMREIEGFRAHNIGFALQKGELLPHLSLFDNAALILKFLGKNEQEIQDTLTKQFKRFYQHEEKDGHLEKIMNSKPANVSQGQYQRGAIVRALANDPKIILADEPTGNLDQRTGEEAMKFFRMTIESSIKEKGNEQSVIVVTHDVLLALEYADEIIILKNGQQSAQISKEAPQKWRTNDGLVLSEEELKQKIYSEYL